MDHQSLEQQARPKFFETEWVLYLELLGILYSVHEDQTVWLHDLSHADALLSLYSDYSQSCWCLECDFSTSAVFPLDDFLKILGLDRHLDVLLHSLECGRMTLKMWVYLDISHHTVLLMSSEKVAEVEEEGEK